MTTLENSPAPSMPKQQVTDGGAKNPKAARPKADKPPIPEEKQIRIQPPKIQVVEVTIAGKTPLIVHAWDQKAIKAMADKQSGAVRGKIRVARDPEAEFQAARYLTANGEDGFRADAIRLAIIEAADKDLGIPKTKIARAVFVLADDPKTNLVKIISEPPVMRCDPVTVGQGSTDLRYRPMYETWQMRFKVRFDADMVDVESLYNLINRAGFGVGLGEWRPQKRGNFGQFEVVA